MLLPLFIRLLLPLLLASQAFALACMLLITAVSIITGLVVIVITVQVSRAIVIAVNVVISQAFQALLKALSALLQHQIQLRF